MEKKKIKRPSITKGGNNPHPENIGRLVGNPPSALKPPPKPKPSPPIMLNWCGVPIDKAMPEWKVKAICAGLAIMITALVVLIGISFGFESCQCGRFYRAIFSCSLDLILYLCIFFLTSF